MISAKKLVCALAALISLDIVLTILAVGYMGATELNVLSSTLGFPIFMIVKFVASLIAVYVLYKLCLPACPEFTRVGGWALTFVYGGLGVFNTYQIVGAVA